MKPSLLFHWSPHISIFLHAGTNSLAYFRDKKHALCNDPRTRELQRKDSRSPCSPFDSPAFRATDSYSLRIHQSGIAEPLSFAKRRNPNHSLLDSFKQFLTNSEFSEYIPHPTTTRQKSVKRPVMLRSVGLRASWDLPSSPSLILPVTSVLLIEFCSCLAQVSCADMISRGRQETPTVPGTLVFEWYLELRYYN